MLHICQGNCFCESSGNNFAKAKVLYCYGEVSVIYCQCSYDCGAQNSAKLK